MFESKGSFDWSKVNDVWMRAEKDEPVQKKSAYEKLPDGKYVVDVSSARITTTKGTGAPCLLWVMDVQEGTYASKRVYKRNMLLTEKNMTWLAKDLNTCNVPLPENLSDLDTTRLEDLRLAITVKTKNDYTDVYINRIVDMEAAASRVTNEFDDDDVPF